MKGRTVVHLAAVAAAVALAGCQGVKQDLGIGVKRPPDEFAVYSRAPLSVPPDFALRPPAPGAGNDSLAARNSAKDLLLGNAAGQSPAAASGQFSAGTEALLARTGGLNASSEVREQVNRESTILADAQLSFTERLMFWSDTPEQSTVVNAPAEAQRIREAQSLGKPVVTGETPIIEPRPRGALEGIFN
jgi:Protein of unknown function (DUF3035).